MISEKGLMEYIKYYAGMIESSARMIKENINGFKHPRIRNEIEYHIKKLEEYVKKLTGEWEMLKLVERRRGMR